MCSGVFSANKLAVKLVLFASNTHIKLSIHTFVNSKSKWRPISAILIIKNHNAKGKRTFWCLSITSANNNSNSEHFGTSQCIIYRLFKQSKTRKNFSAKKKWSNKISNSHFLQKFDGQNAILSYLKEVYLGGSSIFWFWIFIETIHPGQSKSTESDIRHPRHPKMPTQGPIDPHSYLIPASYATSPINTLQCSRCETKVRLRQSSVF